MNKIRMFCIIFICLFLLIPVYGQNKKLVVADFDTGEVNNLGESFSMNAKKPSTLVYTFDKDKPLGGTGRSLKLLYKKEGDERHWIAWWTYLNRNIADFDTFSFWVRGKTGKENFSITFSESEEKTSILYLDDFLPDGVPKEWKKVSIPMGKFLESFAAIPEKIETLVVGFPEYGEGTLYIDNIMFEKSPPAEKKEIRINGFEDENPNLCYYKKIYGESDLDLDSSKQAHYGSCALKMNYYLRSYRGFQAQAGFLYKLKKTLDISKAEAIHIWVRGDGSGNAFYLNVTDDNDEVFSHIDRNVLFHDEWRKVTIVLKDLEKRRMGRPVMSGKIKTIEIGVLGTEIESRKSYILIDELTLSGKDIQVPEEKGSITPLMKKYLEWHSLKFLKEVKSETQIWDTEASGLRIFQNFILRTDFTFRNFNFQGDIVIYGRIRPFYESGSSEENDYEKEVRSKDYDVVGRNLKLNILDITYGLERITLGNIEVDYNKYTIVGQKQYEGIEIEGAVDGFNYNTFLLKLWNDSYSLGGKAEFDFWDLTAKIVGLGNSATALSFQSIDKVKSTKIFENTMYNISLKKVLSSKFSINTFYGKNQWKFYGTSMKTNQTGFDDEGVPVLGRIFSTPITYNEEGFTAGFESHDFPWEGLLSYFNYTHLSDYFYLSPYTKETGDSLHGDFEDFLTGRKYMPVDGIGFNASLAQYIWWFRLAGEWYRYHLKSDTNATKWEQYYSISRSKIAGVTLTFTYGRRELDKWYLVPKAGEPGFIPDGYYSDMYWVVAEYFFANQGHLMVKYNFNDITERYDKEEGAVRPGYIAEVFSALFSYYVSLNAQIELEYKYTHPKEYMVKYGYWPPENFTSARLNVTF
ncbi:MAG: CIA30 family protein [Spirochaetes bacterium]|nr:CIA30 family protein [Spirochaetota bacterium]